jgi:hypothetical protein
MFIVFRVTIVLLLSVTDSSVSRVNLTFNDQIIYNANCNRVFILFVDRKASNTDQKSDIEDIGSDNSDNDESTLVDNIDNGDDNDESMLIDNIDNHGSRIHKQTRKKLQSTKLQKNRAKISDRHGYTKTSLGEKRNLMSSTVPISGENTGISPRVVYTKFR